MRPQFDKATNVLTISVALQSPTSEPRGWSVETDPELGRCLVARRDFEAGECVVVEQPALFCPKLANTACRSGGTELQGVFRRVLERFCEAEALLQQSIEEMFFVCPFDNPGEVVATWIQAIDAVAKEEFAVGQPLSKLRAIGLAFLLNGHKFKDGWALNPIGSKLAHSCEPNTRYTCDHQRHPNRAVHLALRPIAAGEQLTATYTHFGRSTAQRQEALLETKLFVCNCPRCRAPDHAGEVPCPGCHPRSKEGFLSEYAATAFFQSDVHYAVPIPAGCSHQECGSQPLFGWRCDHCDKTYTDEEVLPTVFQICAGRDVEKALELAAAQLDCMLDDTGQVAASDVAEVYRLASSVLGSHHCTTVKVVAIESEQINSQIQANPEAATPEQLHMLSEDLELCWRFCIRSGVCPSMVNVLKCASVALLPRVFSVRALAVHLLWSHTLGNTRSSFLDNLKLPRTLLAATQCMLEAAQAAREQDENAEASLFERASKMSTHRVEVIGLVSHSEHNQKIGHVTSWDPSVGRYDVELDDCIISIKPEHLRSVPTPATTETTLRDSYKILVFDGEESS